MEPSEGNGLTPEQKQIAASISMQASDLIGLIDQLAGIDEDLDESKAALIDLRDRANRLAGGT